MAGKIQQRFRISQGEWVCAGCGAQMLEAADAEGGVMMDHEPSCEEVATMAALRRGQQ